MSDTSTRWVLNATVVGAGALPHPGPAEPAAAPGRRPTSRRPRLVRRRIR